MTAPRFWQQTSRQSIAVTLLAPLGKLYADLVQKRSLRTPRYRSVLPVVCVGNVVMGGSGKTPVVEAVVRLLQEQGKNPAVLMRGYGGKIKKATWVDAQNGDASLYGDEALLHARVAPVMVSPDRVDGAKIIEQDKTITHIVMDDGFQNSALHKDVCLLVVDGKNPIGNGHVFPAGPLRETLENGLKRADALVVLGNDAFSLEARYQFMLPVLRADLRVENAADISGKPVLAFAGIGYPEKFFNTLRSCDAVLIETHGFPDHHSYKPHELSVLLERAASIGAIPVTTRKDWVRLPQNIQQKIHVLDVSLEWHNPDAVREALKKID